MFEKQENQPEGLLYTWLDCCYHRFGFIVGETKNQSFVRW
jgi:hypothetical protein